MRVSGRIKRRVMLGLTMMALLVLTGCVTTRSEGGSFREPPYTVIEEADVPAELQQKITENKKTPFQITFGDGEYLYLARGYGRQSDDGYQAAVESLREEAGNIYLKTELIGPPSGSESADGSTYPYIVLKMKYSSKQVVFE